MGFCDGVFLKQTAITIIKEKDKKIVQSAAYAYTPYGDGKAGEILYTAAGKYRFQIIRLAEFDVTGAYNIAILKRDSAGVITLTLRQQEDEIPPMHESDSVMDARDDAIICVLSANAYAMLMGYIFKSLKN